MTFSGDGLLLACGCGSELKIFEVGTGNHVAGGWGHKHDSLILSLSFSPKDYVLAVSFGCDHGCVQV